MKIVLDLYGIVVFFSFVNPTGLKQEVKDTYIKNVSASQWTSEYISSFSEDIPLRKIQKLLARLPLKFVNEAKKMLTQVYFHSRGKCYKLTFRSFFMSVTKKS